MSDFTNVTNVADNAEYVGAEVDHHFQTLFVWQFNIQYFISIRKQQLNGVILQMTS